jgi:serine/threonine protein kinase
MQDLCGISIAQYKILRKLEGGHMGALYKAQDTRLQRLVAIKFLPSDFILNSQAKERFVREAQAVSLLDHQNICTIHEFNQTPDGLLYIVMPFYQGASLQDILIRRRFDYGQVIDIAIQIINALVTAHQAGIIHRDIKPANIFLTNDGVIKLLDFGLAKLTGQDKDITVVESTGTIAYMSPEQIMGREIDARSDIWSFGIILFEMLTGHRPFSGEYIQTISYSILNEDPPAVRDICQDIPPELELLVKKTLAKKPRKRYHLARDVLSDLQKIKKLSQNE